MRPSAFGLLALIVAGWLLCLPAFAQTPRNHVSLDLYAFGQGDDSKDPLRNESFQYGSFALATRIQITEVFAVRANATLAYIITGERKEVPKTVKNSEVTSASEDTLTLDSVITVEIRPKGSPWTFSLSAFYHHQFAFISPGVDLSVQAELFGGDSVLFATYSIRPSNVHFRWWDDRDRGEDYQLTNNIMVGLTQTLTPSWVASVNVQYTRQDGLLRGGYHFVGLYDGKGAPVKLSDEVVPRQRNRAQLNLRTRVSPLLGLSFGLDLSGYIDDWGIASGAVQPSIEFPVRKWLRLRIWYRFLIQQGSRYYVRRPLADQPFQTQDSDLGSFMIHAPGIFALIPLLWTRNPQWLLRFSLIGFYRTDGIFAVGANSGVVARW